MDEERASQGLPRRTLALIELLAERDRLLLPEIARALGVHQRTASRLAETMVAAGWIQEAGNGARQYELTYRVLTVAGRLAARNRLIQVAGPFVRQLRDRLGESAHLAVPVAGRALQIIDEAGPHPPAVRSRLGEALPVHATAVGKAILAFRSELLDHPANSVLRRYTPATRIDRDELLVELAGIRERGYAVDDEEFHLDTRCVAAPVRDLSGLVVGSIGVSGPSARISGDLLARCCDLVSATAEQLSEILGFVPALDGRSQDFT